MRSKEENIEVVGARAHNLKNIDISIPKNKLVVITGISGSGKSSLAFDTIYAEGHRRYMETFGTYARQFMGELERPDVDKISGLSPVISIEQKTTNKNPRSTVGTVTEVYDFLRLFFARVGEAYSLNTGKKMVKFSDEEIVSDLFKKLPGKKITVLAPLVRGRKGHYRELFEETRKKGFVRVRVDGELKELVPKMQVDRYKMHDIEVVIDRLVVEADMKVRIGQSIQQSMQIGKGLIFILDHDNDKLIQYSKKLMCAETGISYEEPSPNTFSFNSPYGACRICKWIGQQYTIDLNAVIPDRNISIADGAILPLGEARDSYYFKMVEQLAKKKKFSLKTPIDQLSKSALNLVLFGNEDGLDAESADLENEDYPGVVNMVVRWFTDSSSDMVREWAEKYMMLKPCASCNGTRLKEESLWFKIDETNIAELSNMDLISLNDWFKDLEKRLDKKQNAIAKDILKEIRSRVVFLLDVGLGYLSLNRPTRSLSGGESQRIRLATQIGSQLQGITYILDEPSIGLHQRDNQQLIHALQNLRDIGNSVLVVEHDKDIMWASDHLIDVGPRAGIHGGTIVAQGTPKEVCNSNSETALFLNNRKKIELPIERRKGNGLQIELVGAKGNNLKNVNAVFPLGTFIVVSGVSGSGKSTLINETLYPLLSKHCFDSKADPMPYKRIAGLEHIDKVIEIDQSPIGRTPRSNPATYCNFFSDIRQLYAAVPEAKIRGYGAGRFSFNVKAGRCDVCEGGGLRVIEMNFLPDVYVHCEKCNGKRYNRETLEIRYKGKSISDVLDMTVEEAVVFFQQVPYLYRKIKVLQDVGLGYVTLGQSAVTLSGGEAQRVKLATELSKKDTGKTFYILDEPTTGLHFQDINLLLNVLNKLVNRGNTVLVIEHNMDVVKMADHIIDLGPEGGSGGGNILYQGDVYGLLKVKGSHTAKFLKHELV
ncbi:MAG: excinuclease ABC subunit UvrA [Chitinophagaceae bacterium]